jgi:hypothetical protein
VGFGRHFDAFGYVGIRKGAASGLASLVVADRLEQAAPNDFECFFSRNRFPKGLNAAESFFETAKGGHAALATGLDV